MFADPSPGSGIPARPPVVEAISEIREQIQRATIESGREPSSVRLVAITKTRTVEEIQLALGAGAEDFGENYIQEAREKARRIPGARWHLVGNLQKNKVNLAVDLFEVIHSLDSLSLIQKVEARCVARNRHLIGLIQVRLGGEASKKGLLPKAVFELLDELAQDPPQYLRLSGLMAVPPPVENAEENRVHFRALKELLDEIVSRGYAFWSGEELSMGMSDDFLVAISEGATMIRLGRSLFGERDLPAE